MFAKITSITRLGLRTSNNISAEYTRTLSLGRCLSAADSTKPMADSVEEQCIRDYVPYFSKDILKYVSACGHFDNILYSN